MDTDNLHFHRLAHGNERHENYSSVVETAHAPASKGQFMDGNFQAIHGFFQSNKKGQPGELSLYG